MKKSKKSIKLTSTELFFNDLINSVNIFIELRNKGGAFWGSNEECDAFIRMEKLLEHIKAYREK